MTEHRFGRAGGPTTQMIRESADITVSSPFRSDYEWSRLSKFYNAY